MILATALLPIHLLLAPLELVGGIAAPPGCTVDAELTREANDKASLETKQMISQVDSDPQRTPQEKAELKRKLGRLKIQMCLCTKSLDEVVGFYNASMKASFISAERDILHDLRDLARSGHFLLDDETVKAWDGKTARASRWSRFDGTVEIDVEDHLIDVRTGKVTKRTVLMVTALE